MSDPDALGSAAHPAPEPTTAAVPEAVETTASESVETAVPGSVEPTAPDSVQTTAARAAATEARRQAVAIAEATFFDDPAAFREWLEDNADRSKGIWIRFAKPESGVEGGTHAQALDEALCFGWTDAQKVADEDDRFWIQRFTPRAAGSPWSQADRDRAAKLITEQRVAPGGRREYQQAKADGRLDAAYAPVSTDTLPGDLAAALGAVPAAEAFFDELDDRNTQMILRRVETAADAETRARRISTFVDMLARGEKLYPRRPKAR